MSFNPGDPVWCKVDPGHHAFGSAGEIAATIARRNEFLPGWYTIDIGAEHWAAPEHYLRPRKPPPAREELGDWELCPWRPIRVPETVSGEP